MSLVALLYTLAAYGLSVLGLNQLVLCVLYLALRGRRPPPPPDPKTWPRVTVQLPLYNERYVAERVIDAACRLDYPRDRLDIQVLDDSTDDTAALVQARVEFHRARGMDIVHIRREGREGFKAGALAEGLKTARGEFIAVFDADFAPLPDFLKRLVPRLATDSGLGMMQARWGHLNAEAGPFTRAQAIALDGHFIVEQGARSLAGLLLNFNGSAGIWRRACIEDAGGWQGDTLAEDIDLSYRAQMRGWRLDYTPDVLAPAEIPTLMLAFKRQQFRWAKGTIQVLRKLGGELLRARLPLAVRVAGLLHLSGYFIHPLMTTLLLASLPVILTHEFDRLPLGTLSLAGLGPPLLFALSQWAAYPNGTRRLAFFPALVLVGTGVALSNTVAVAEALWGRASDFKRTPKLPPGASGYAISIDWTTGGELALAGYALVTMFVAASTAPGITLFLGVYAASFLYTALISLWQHLAPRLMLHPPAPEREARSARAGVDQASSARLPLS